MTSPPPPAPLDRFRKPASGPSAADLADRARWDAMAEASLPTVQAAAEKWRTGLAAFVTLVTGGLLLKGPEAAQDLPTAWRVAVTVLGGAGLLGAVTGLWLALRAAAGSPARLNREAILSRHGTILEWQVACADAASNALRRARVLVGLSLVLLGATVVVWWWAPAPSTSLVRVEVSDDEVCGTLLSADRQRLRVRRPGTSEARVVPFDDVVNLRVVDEC